MAFLEDPRLRQRWNQISSNAETVTENAAAGIWTFQHRYISPCFAGVGHALESCTSVCLGDRDDRARRARERERARGLRRAEFSFDFYDDWDDFADDEGIGSGGGIGGGSGGGGLLGNWGRNQDWDRLVAGSGSQKRHGGDVVEQPRRKRGMSYGTRGARRKAPEDDPTIIPSTAPLGFLGKLPWKVGGTLRYKPSAANLQEHPGAARHGAAQENEPLLGRDEDEMDYFQQVEAPQTRKRSGTTGSGDTSDSYRSRNDLFPSDGEGEEDAVPLDDEFTIALDRVDDRSSNRTRSSKGKRTASGANMSRTVSRGTLSSSVSRPSLKGRMSSGSIMQLSERETAPSLKDLQFEEEQARKEEEAHIAQKRRAAAQLAVERGLNSESYLPDILPEVKAGPEVKAKLVQVEGVPEPLVAEHGTVDDFETDAALGEARDEESSIEARLQQEQDVPVAGFIPARLPYFR